MDKEDLLRNPLDDDKEYSEVLEKVRKRRAAALARKEPPVEPVLAVRDVVSREPEKDPSYEELAARYDYAMAMLK